MPTFVADEIVTATKLNAGTARDWDDWTPTPTNMAFGNGTVVARYVQVGKLVVAQFEFTFGSSGSSVGANPTVTLPVTASSAFAAFRSFVGAAQLFDANGSEHMGIVRLASTTEVNVRSLVSSGASLVTGGIGATAPFTWATGDIYSFQAIYEVA